ncbi:TetR/AcrR family transcriptional regulator [Streptomyces nodosus]|uniref:TetR family transcriptional regulator n=1 Tax=Streptomyces nodosus TaxID=40318 RepID=A0A5P2VWH1_9ACTN|nr:TetR/AcrR family transcriptional regulator [Streptomyces nodosus]MBB4789801.1 AcrR family transcriptional regulator [Streptomyces nodosus]QEV37545.1 TetR family transcriptional regulator [Streptomyces nodosus]
MNLRERKKLATWRAIRSAALRLFDEQGYEATTVEQIAAAANVSRATFFNYFAGKDAAVLDQDPEERLNWQALMDDRPADEPLWDSLTAILTGFCESLRDRMPLQRRLKAQSPAFAQSAQRFGEQFFNDLRHWVESRVTGSDDLTPILQLNLALAATITAYQTWPAEESFDGYLRRLHLCFRQAGPVTPLT